MGKSISKSGTPESAIREPISDKKRHIFKTIYSMKGRQEMLARQRIFEIVIGLSILVLTLFACAPRAEPAGPEPTDIRETQPPATDTGSQGGEASG